MNWDHSGGLVLDAFLAEWQRATSDRSYQPIGGDSSDAAAARFIGAVCDIAAAGPVGAVIAVVSHGGVTVDALRTLLGDEQLDAHDPHLIPNGVPTCAVTSLSIEGESVRVISLPSTDHLTGDWAPGGG